MPGIKKKPFTEKEDDGQPLHEPMKGKDLRDYTIAWICALSTEAVAAGALLDEELPPPSDRPVDDQNSYTYGLIAGHSVVIAHLPQGQYGHSSAAAVAKDMLRSFRSIRFGLMVGIAGGAPYGSRDIRLGDVVVGYSSGSSPAVISYRFGKPIQNEGFKRSEHLNSPPAILLNAVTKLKADQKRRNVSLAPMASALIDGYPHLRKDFGYPGRDQDRLYRSDFTEKDKARVGADDTSADAPCVKSRRPRDPNPDDPMVHYGPIASADQLLKDAEIRDKFARDDDIHCFDMEAAGYMNSFPCLVIRGICDYADSHKHEVWQGYAATTAAVWAKQLLEIIPTSDVTQTRFAAQQVQEARG